MTATPNVAPRPSLGLRLVHATPIIGTMARDIARDVNNVFYALVVLVTAVVLAIKLWGLAALTLTALALVPVMFVFFVVICWPLPKRR